MDDLETGFWQSNGDGTQSYFYVVNLTDGELATARFMQARGYDCGFLDNADTLEATEQGATLKFREHQAWEVKDAADNALETGGDYFTCATHELLGKVQVFLDSIV